MHDVTSRDANALPVLPRRSGAPAWLATAIVVVAVLSLIGALFPATATLTDGPSRR